jgi:hypothetical protein
MRSVVLIAALSAACAEVRLPGKSATPESGSDAPSESDGGVSVSPDGGGPVVVDMKCPRLQMPAAAATVYVDAAKDGDGSKGSPFKTIAQAFDKAGDKGVIFVAAGTYAESLVIPDKDLAVYGGFAAGFASRTDACATVLESTGTVLSASFEVKSFALDGVTVQKGARGLSVDGDGSVPGTFTITSSVFAENGRSNAIGGAMSLLNVNAKVAKSVFRDNRAEKGAAIAHYSETASMDIETSLFEKNIGHGDHGGAVYISPKSGKIQRNTFRSNEIGKTAGYGWGGGVIVYKAGSAATKVDFAYNVFTDNLASVGGGLFIDDGASATLSHDLFYRNRSLANSGAARGAAIYVDGLGGPTQGSTLFAEHITVASNNLDASGKAIKGQGGGAYLESYSRATFTNSIFWNNGEETFWGDPTCAIVVRYSIAPAQCPICTVGAGVLQPASIHFADEAKNDYHEKSTAGRYANGAWIKDDVTSPAVDRGDPGASAAEETAPNGARANLGVYGGTVEASRSP